MRWHLVLQVVAYVVAVGMLYEAFAEVRKFRMVGLSDSGTGFRSVLRDTFRTPGRVANLPGLCGGNSCLERKMTGPQAPCWALLGLKIYPALALLWLIATRRYVAVCSFLLSGVTMVGIGLLVFAAPIRAIIICGSCRTCSGDAGV